MSLNNRLAKLEKALPPLPLRCDAPDITPARRDAVHERFESIMSGAIALMSGEEFDQVMAGLKLSHIHGPYSEWIDHLNDGNCRLPLLTPQSMHAVLLALVSPQRDVFRRLCRQCGMEYPRKKSAIADWKPLPGKTPFVDPPPWYDIPCFFASCPGCGASNYDSEWSHLLSGRRPWMNLDGCARRVSISRT